MAEGEPPSVELVIDETVEEDKGEQPAEKEEESQEPKTLPPFTYIDFVPQCLGSQIDGKEPKFADFGTLIEQANQWLLSMPQFSVYKCETINTKLGIDFAVDNDTVLHHYSSHGKNTFLRILRLWLMPKLDTSSPTQQLAYITVLPDHPSGDVTSYINNMAGAAPARSISDPSFPSFDPLNDTVEKLNKHLDAKPLPGRVLTIETLTYKCQESGSSEPMEVEGTCWSESGNSARVYIYALRVFYVVGQPAFEKLGIKDVVPEIHQNRDGVNLRVKFSTTSQAIATASQWINSQQGIRLVSIQSVNVKLEKKFGAGPWIVDSNFPGYTENQNLNEFRFVKALRLAYVKDKKHDNLSAYSSVTLTSRLFIPERLMGKNFESFSKTMLKVIRWLHATRVSVFACETTKYHMSSADGYGQGFSEEKPDYQVHTYSGQHYLTCIRLYFPATFQEPPPEIPEVTDASWGCVMS